MFFEVVLKKGEYQNWRKIPRESFFIIPYLSISLISACLSESFERSLQVFSFAAFTFLLFFVVPYFFREEYFPKIKKIIILVTFFASVFSFYQFLGDMMGIPKALTGLQFRYTRAIFGFPRPHSTLSEPLFFANFLIFPLSFLLSEILNSKNGKNRRFWYFEILVFLLGVASLFLTLSRGGILGFLVAMVFVLLFNLKNFFQKKLIPLYLAFSSAFSIFSVFFILLFGNNAKTFLSHMTNLFYGTSLEERDVSTKIALENFLKNPVSGSGIGSFGYIYKRETGFSQKGFQTVNNQYLEILTETGIVGFFTFFLFVTIFIARILRKIFDTKDLHRKNLIIGVFAGMMGTFVQWMSFSTLYTFWIWLWVALSLCL